MATEKPQCYHALKELVMKDSFTYIRNEFQSPVLHSGGRVAGLDEVGRGPLAGPVMAGCVILESGFDGSGMNDSKKLSASKRKVLLEKIQAEAFGVGLGIVSACGIDRLNIYQASRKAMCEALEDAGPGATLVLTDAMPLKIPGLEVRDLVKGDLREECIMAASIVAKEARDTYMCNLHEKYPDYGFASHMGYPTAQHRRVLKEIGPCPEHRLSFKPVMDALLDFPDQLERWSAERGAREIVALATAMKMGERLEPYRKMLWSTL